MLKKLWSHKSGPKSRTQLWKWQIKCRYIEETEMCRWLECASETWCFQWRRRQVGCEAVDGWSCRQEGMWMIQGTGITRWEWRKIHKNRHKKSKNLQCWVTKTYRFHGNWHNKLVLKEWKTGASSIAEMMSGLIAAALEVSIKQLLKDHHAPLSDKDRLTEESQNKPGRWKTPETEGKTSDMAVTMIKNTAPNSFAKIDKSHNPRAAWFICIWLHYRKIQLRKTEKIWNMLLKQSSPNRYLTDIPWSVQLKKHKLGK